MLTNSTLAVVVLGLYTGCSGAFGAEPSLPAGSPASGAGGAAAPAPAGQPSGDAQAIMLQGATQGVLREAISGSPPAPTYAIGGTVTGLVGSGLVLDNGGEDIAISADGAFTFPTQLAGGAIYSVTVTTQPGSPSETCSVSAASGTVADADVSSVVVTCATSSYTVGGTVTGLAGGGLLLRDNGGDDLLPQADGSFVFATAIASSGSYAVTVDAQPTGPAQTCTATMSAGIVGAGPVTSVVVTCVTASHAIGGSVGGLHGTLVLLDNGGDALTLGADGAFTFATLLASGAGYDVSIATQPAGQHCVVSAAADTVGDGDVSSVVVTCVEASCVNLGWKEGNADWTCPAGYRMPTADEYATVSPCIDPYDTGRFSRYEDIATAVGGCGCDWNADFCDVPSIDTMRAGRSCGDYAQLHICVTQ